jgi:hypothetical protein
MDYKNGKIYKLQCDDGYYYFGSSVTTLTKRLYHHKYKSKHQNKCHVYQHINTIGWHRVRIVLVEDYSCENKQQLIRKEDEYIRLHKDNPLCLNMICAFRTPEQHAEQKKQRYEQNKEEILERKRQRLANKKLLLEQ